MFVETPRKVITIKAFDPSARMFISANNMFLFFLFVHAYIDIRQSDWLQERAAFYNILTVVQKNIFSDKQRSKDNFQTQNMTRKIEKSALLILNIVRYSEFTSMGIVPSPKCTFLGPKCEKNKYKHRNNTAGQCYIF
jgi:hypothetical protein